MPLRGDHERGKALVPFVGQFVTVTTRPIDDDASPQPAMSFIGILAAFDATVITLFGAAQVETETREIVDVLRESPAKSAASPLYINLKFRSLAKVARSSAATVARLFQDPNRALVPPMSEAARTAAARFLARVMVRRYVCTTMVGAVKRAGGIEDDDEDDNGAARRGEGRSRRPDDEDPEQALQDAVARAVGNAAPNDTTLVGRVRMPVVLHVASACTAITRVSSALASSESSEAPDTTSRGPPTRAAAASDAGESNGDGSRRPSGLAQYITDPSPVAGVARDVPPLLNTMSCGELRAMIEEEVATLRTFFAPRRNSPTSELVSVLNEYVKRCFLFTIILSVGFCVMGGVMIGSAISGPLTTGGLAGDYAGYMWYLLIVPGIVSACHGVSLSARSEDSSNPASKYPRVWLAAELLTIALLFPGFVFGAMFLNTRNTPRSELKDPESFYNSLASKSDSKICTFQEVERCSGFSERCYFAANETTVFVIQRPDCAISCQMSLTFLRNLPEAHCGPKLIETVDSVAKQSIAFECIFAGFVVLRVLGLYLLRRYYTARATRAHQAAVLRMIDAANGGGGG